MTGFANRKHRPTVTRSIPSSRAIRHGPRHCRGGIARRPPSDVGFGHRTPRVFDLESGRKEATMSFCVSVMHSARREIGTQTSVDQNSAPGRDAFHA
jgi:hypothetical protein